MVGSASRDRPHSSSDRPLPPLLAIVGNCPSPYRTAQHLRYVEEIPGLRLASLFLYEFSAHEWDNPLPEAIGPVLLSPGRSVLGRFTAGGFVGQARNARRTVRWLREHRPEVVLLTGYADLAFLTTMIWCRSSRTPYVLYCDSNVRGDRATGLRSLAKRIVLEPAVAGARAIGVTGRAGLRYFYRYGAARRPTVFLPPQPDFESIRNLSEAEVAATGGRLGLAAGRRRFLVSGRVAPEKGVDLLLEAFATVAPEAPEWDLVVAGDGPDRAALEAALPEALRDRVIWLGWVPDRPTLGAVYRSCDALAMPSHYEPWGVVVLEAAAAGLALVVSDVVGAAVELVQDSVNGYIVPDGDGAALAEALRRVTRAADELGGASLGVLAAWERASDPVAGLLLALEACGLDRATLTTAPLVA